MSKEIQLTRGKVALVDDEDFEELNKYKWYVSTKGYAVRNSREGNKRIIVYMHIVVFGDFGADHKDRNKLNNQKDNLRPATRSQNMSNRIFMNNATGYRGVYNRDNGQPRCFYAMCRKDKKAHFSKYFHTAPEAAAAYNELSLKLHGEFAVLNVI